MKQSQGAPSSWQPLMSVLSEDLPFLHISHKWILPEGGLRCASLAQPDVLKVHLRPGIGQRSFLLPLHRILPWRDGAVIPLLTPVLSSATLPWNSPAV